MNNKGSQFRIALSRNGEDDFEECILVNNIPHNDASNPIYDEEKQEFTFTEYSLTVNIPDVNCDDCTLQLVNVVPDGNNACTYDPKETENGLNGRCSTNYHSCANVKISGGNYARDKYTCETADWAFTNDDAYKYSKSDAAWLDTLLMDKHVPAAFRNDVPQSANDEGTIVAIVNNQFDDAVENLKTDMVQRANDEIELKAQFVTALRFRDVPLPEDMEIVDARLTLWVKGLSGNDTDADAASVVTSFGMSFEKTADSAAIMSENQDITGRTLTDSNNVVGGHIVASQSGRWTSNDLKDLLQEVVDDTEWESGNALTLIIDVELDGGNLKVQTYESDYPAELTIKYRRKMQPGETPEPTAAPSPLPDQPCTYALHQRILGNWQSQGDWYSGRVDKVHENKEGIKDMCVYDVVYDDGDKEAGLEDKDLAAETKHPRSEFQLRELVDVKVNGVWKRGQIRILQKDGTYTVETMEGDVFTSVPLEEIRQWVQFFVGDSIEIKQCWWFKADITKVQPDGRYQCQMEDGYVANVPYNEMREIVDVRYQSGEQVKLYIDGKWEDGFVIIAHEDGTYMVGEAKTNLIMMNWPADKMSKLSQGGGR